MNITKGKIPTAIKTVIYGPEGIGKSTFASRFPGAVFLDTEGSTVHMDVARLDTPRGWSDIMTAVNWCIEHPDQLGTLVIDTMDWAEAFAIRSVCASKKVTGIEDIPYGKGYVFVKDLVRELLEKLDQLKDKGVNIVLTAHAIVRKFELPDEMGSFDRYALKLNEKNVAPLVKEWADLLLFANYKTDVVTAQDGKKRATGGRKRVMYASHSATWDAKNRFGLADELPFDFEAIAHLFDITVEETHADPANPAPAAPPAPEATKLPSKPKKAQKAQNEAENVRPASMTSEDPEKDAALSRLWVLMRSINVTDPLMLQSVVSSKEYYPGSVVPKDYDTDFITDVLLEAWEPVSKQLITVANDLPF